jgi:hypothetical protein
MNRMVYNPRTGIYEQENEFQDMYNSNPRFSNSDSDDDTDMFGNNLYGNRCIGGNAALQPNYSGYNTTLGTRELNSAVKLQQDALKFNENRKKTEHDRYVAKEAQTAANAKICAANYKKSAQCAELKEQVKIQKKNTK